MFEMFKIKIKSEQKTQRVPRWLQRPITHCQWAVNTSAHVQLHVLSVARYVSNCLDQLPLLKQVKQHKWLSVVRLIMWLLLLRGFPKAWRNGAAPRTLRLAIPASARHVYAQMWGSARSHAQVSWNQPMHNTGSQANAYQTIITWISVWKTLLPMLQ